MLHAGTKAVASELFSKVIDVSGGQLSARDAVAIGLLLCRNQVCNKLNLRNTDLTDGGATQAGIYRIAHSFKTSHIISLDLTNTGIDPLGSRAIGHNLETNEVLNQRI
jgi:hypothetical protein